MITAMLSSSNFLLLPASESSSSCNLVVVLIGILKVDCAKIFYCVQIIIPITSALWLKMDHYVV